MKKLFSAFALASVGLISQAANSAPATPPWISAKQFASDYPDYVYSGDYSIKSCHKDDEGKMVTVENVATVLTHKNSWNEVSAGKSKAEKEALRAEAVNLTSSVVNAAWRANVDGLPLNKVVSSNPRYPDLGHEFITVENLVKKETGLFTLSGTVSDRPIVHRGCNLK